MMIKFFLKDKTELFKSERVNNIKNIKNRIIKQLTNQTKFKNRFIYQQLVMFQKEPVWDRLALL